MRRIGVLIEVVCVVMMFAAAAGAAGTLKAVDSGFQDIEIVDHHVAIVINNGFARTEVTQTFHNPNTSDIEAVYRCPVPKSASLSEMTIYTGEQELNGEVVDREKARLIYEDERSKGNDAGLAEKQKYQYYDFSISRVPAADNVRVRFLYYQPLEIDTGVGRYVYPLEGGGTDDAGKSFWFQREKVEKSLSISLELKSAWPVSTVRAPGFEAAATIDKLDEGHYMLNMELQDASLNRDFVLYYRLQDGLPGRVEVIPYREAGDEHGTFMMVVTPGVDLQPIDRGADYLFVLDVSGSMRGKIATLARGMSGALKALKPDDRFRIVVFETSARELTRTWNAATADNVRRAIEMVEALQAKGSTNLYEGLARGLKKLDDDRATSIVLVTDAVTNTGVVDPPAFHKLMKKYDVRVFGFLMSNSANWPLMRTICDATGGFYACVSNADDILGQLLLAKSKITHECMHDARMKVSGVKVFDTTDEFFGKVYRGQQMVIFGKYKSSGRATVALKTSLTGEDKTYSTTFDFPETDIENPEIERLWAMHTIETIEAKKMAGLMDVGESENAIEDLGVAYQLVTDYTSMVMLADEKFVEHGIARSNQARVAKERAAQAVRAVQAPRIARVDTQAPMFNHQASHISPKGNNGGGSGGLGAIDPFTAAGAMALGAAALAASRRRRKGKRS